MKKEILRKKLHKVGFKEPSIRALLNGTRKPALEKALILELEHNVPARVWLNIKSFITSNNSINIPSEYTTATKEKVS